MTLAGPAALPRRRLLLTLLAMTALALGLLVSPAEERASAHTATDPRPAVHGLTIRLRPGASGVDVVISWDRPTGEQARGLTWTSVYFGANPQPILVFPPETNATVPSMAPGRYPVGVELDYGPRSAYTHTARARASVTVPLHLVEAASASPTPESHRTAAAPAAEPAPWTGHTRDAALLGAALLLGAGLLAARRRRARR